MAIPLFQSEAQDAIRKLSRKDYGSSTERDALLEKVMAAEKIKAKEVGWMLFKPDRVLRDAGAELLTKLKSPDTVDIIIHESRGQAEAAIRSATGVLFRMKIPGTEQRLIDLCKSPEAKIRDTAQRMILDAPPSPTLDPVLWHLATDGALRQRIAVLGRLRTYEMTDALLGRWQALGHDPEEKIVAIALEVLSTKAPEQSIDLIVEKLPLVDYGTQQHLINALSAMAAKHGLAMADRILPLMASGDAGTRSAVIKILTSMPNTREVIKHYLIFSKTLAGWARDRALESMMEFGDALVEPTIELLDDPDEEVRAAALVVASSFDDPRIVPAIIPLLDDEDWWLRVTGCDILGRLKDPRAVEHLVRKLGDDESRWGAVEALGRIGDARALPALGKLLGDPAAEVRIEVILALCNFDHPQINDVLSKVAKQDPNRFVRSRALEVLEMIAERDHKELEGADELRSCALKAEVKAGEPALHALLISTRNQSASDFHLSVSQPPIMRLGSDLVRGRGEPFTPEKTRSMLKEILTEEQWELLKTTQQLDFCYYIPGAGRYRTNIFEDQKGLNAVFRVIPEKPPTITEIGLPSHLSEIASYHQGLVLVCGPAGSGKSTTLAALVNLFNETRHAHVLTMEEPVEFVHPFKNCLINQREIGTHTESFSRALRGALREDPDVIVIGDLRDNETVSLALTAAETGHIVLGTLNSTNAVKAVDRLISSFSIEEQPQIRASLSESLKFVIAQRLLPGVEAKQVACFEILCSTLTVSALIRDQKTFQLPSAMQMGRSAGMVTYDDALKNLVKAGKITAETGYMAADRKDDFETMVSQEFLNSQSLV